MNSKLSHGPAAEAVLKRFSSVIENNKENLQQVKHKVDSKHSSFWDPFKDIVSLQFKPYDRISDFSLISTDNQLVNKTAIVLTYLCKEMADLVSEADKEFYIPISLYGQSNKKEDEDPLLKFAKILPLLHQINCYRTHSLKVLLNVSQQLSALHQKPKTLKKELNSDINAGAAHFQVVFEHIGKLLATLLTLDVLIRENSLLKEHCALYKSLLKRCSSDPSVFDQPKEQLDNLRKFVTALEDKVVRGSMLKNVLAEITKKCSPPLSSNGCLRDEVLTVVIGWSSQIEETGGNNWSWESKGEIVAASALAIFYAVVFDSPDRRVGRTLISLFKKAPCVFIGLNQVWIGDQYLRQHFPSIYSQLDRKSVDSLTSYRKQCLSNKVQKLATDSQVDTLKVLSWSTRIEVASKKSTNKLTKEDLNHRANLLWQGFIIASSLKDSAETILGLHTALVLPMSKTCVVFLCRILENLKAVKMTFHRLTSMLAETLPHLRQYLSFQILVILKNTKDQAKRDRKLSPSFLDVLAALTVAERALSGNCSADSLLVARVALSLGNKDRVIADDDLAKLVSLLRRLMIASDIRGRLNVTTDASFVYEHEVIFSVYFKDFFANLNQTDPKKLHYMMAVMNDLDLVLRRPKILPYREDLQDMLHEELETVLRRELLDKLCESVETELRLKSHSHLQLEQKTPFESSQKLLAPILSLESLELFGNSIRIKDYVSQYLQRTFYNLSVLASHNATSYQTMRGLAHSLYGLVTVDPDLPAHTLEQGVDVLEILRSLDSFVEKFHYNMNQQFFVESQSPNKHLNTVSVQHITNSIRTHGTGVINTAINFTYQFLKKKFKVLSQFLFDEHIKSRLLKELQYWKEIKESESSFPYSRALKFHKGIRVLGLSSKGLSYLDQFRNLVTHIGNAIGYVRLIRSGCLHYISSAIQFIPDLQTVTGLDPIEDEAGKFSHLCKEGLVSSETIKAAQNLDEFILSLTGHFHKETDYFKIMVEVFAPTLRDPKNSHLRNFYLLVPALTVNFVEFFVGAKENITKKYRPGATFTDDGFSVGVAYLLSVLDQKEVFKSLRWWSGVRRVFIKEKQKVEGDIVKAKTGDEKLQQTLALTLSRLQDQLRVFEHLYLNVTSAQVFFRDTSGTGDVVDEKSNS